MGSGGHRRLPAIQVTALGGGRRGSESSPVVPAPTLFERITDDKEGSPEDLG
jgi:hypothetical protein